MCSDAGVAPVAESWRAFDAPGAAIQIQLAGAVEHRHHQANARDAQYCLRRAFCREVRTIRVDAIARPGGHVDRAFGERNLEVLIRSLLVTKLGEIREALIPCVSAPICARPI